MLLPVLSMANETHTPANAIVCNRRNPPSPQNSWTTAKSAYTNKQTLAVCYVYAISSRSMVERDIHYYMYIKFMWQLFSSLGNFDWIARCFLLFFLSFLFCLVIRNYENAGIILSRSAFFLEFMINKQWNIAIRF